MLITDATAATGMPDGRYRLGSLEVEVKDGRCMSGGKLAGSVLTMDLRGPQRDAVSRNGICSRRCGWRP